MANQFVKTGKNWVILGLVILAVVLWLRPWGPRPDSDGRQSNHNENQAENQTVTSVWTCSMHPQIQLPKPGQCPICGMDLIPQAEDQGPGGPWELSLSRESQQLAGIRLAEVTRQAIPREIRMVGKVAYDEKRVGVISAWAPGRIDRLFVDFTGIEVRKGDHMVELYSPELISAQQELRQGMKTLQSGHATMRDASQKRVDAARAKLRLLGLSDDQIGATETRDQLSEHITIEAPMGGVVIVKHLSEGAYVQTGTPIYTMADLSRVWIKLDAYESDLAWLRYGQEVEFEVEAYAGEMFKGRIVFIDPSLNPATRTVKLRMDVPNPGGRLKPDMFVRATAYARVSSGGKVMDPSLAGKWISPMHPEIVKDRPGQCDVCGMDLVRAEVLGFVTDSDTTAPLVIPASAALRTGERAVVYTLVDEETGRFAGREVVLGPQTGDYVVVIAGLTEGEKVVVNGSFKIDSELQIRAKTSMMYRGGSKTEETAGGSDPQKGRTPQGGTPQGPTPAGLKARIQEVLDRYFEIGDELSRDRFDGAKTAAGALAKVSADADGGGLTQTEVETWRDLAGPIARAAKTLGSARDIGQAREAFEPLSRAVVGVLNRYGPPTAEAVLLFHCPMAFDNRGADWLQNHKNTANPYFGSAMFSCGNQSDTFEGTPAKLEDKRQGHRHE